MPARHSNADVSPFHRGRAGSTLEDEDMNHSLNFAVRFVTLLKPIIEAPADHHPVDFLLRSHYEAAIEAIAADTKQPRRQQQTALDL